MVKKLFDRLKRDGSILYEKANKGLFYILVEKLRNQLPEDTKLVGEYVYGGYTSSFPEKLRFFWIVKKIKGKPRIIGSIYYDEKRKKILIELESEVAGR